MDSEQLKKVMDKIESLRTIGGDESAQAYLAEIYPSLPENLQGEIALLTFIDGMKREVEEREAIAAIQEQGVAAVEALEKMEEDL
jgi:hypothetical protein